MTHHERAAAPSDRAVVVSRVFDAPRETMFDAFTDPMKLAQWFAPQPLTVPRAEVDLRVGGRYTLVMRDPDGNDFTSTGEFREITAPDRLVYTDSVEAMPADWVDQVNEARGTAPGTPVTDGTVTVTFEDIGNGRTRTTFSAEYDSAATRDAYVKMQMVEGLEGSFDNLEKLLAHAPSIAR